MDQDKIGAFIAERRKSLSLTQAQLAEKLNITDRAVSKWETGRAMPDVSIMLSLCKTLKISVNDLLNGEVVSMDNYNEKTEKVLLEMAKQKEESDKRLLRLELFIGFTVSIVFLALISIVAYVEMQQWLKITLIIIATVPFALGLAYALRIEQIAGYYKCAKCGHRYVPKYKSVLFAMHINRTRYMKCKNCGKYSWQKKVISKE